MKGKSYTKDFQVRQSWTWKTGRKKKENRKWNVGFVKNFFVRKETQLIHLAPVLHFDFEIRKLFLSIEHKQRPSKIKCKFWVVGGVDFKKVWRAKSWKTSGFFIVTRKHCVLSVFSCVHFSLPFIVLHANNRFDWRRPLCICPQFDCDVF